MPLILKAIPSSAYDAYHLLINDPLVSYMSGTIPHPVDQEFAKKRLLARARNERVLGGEVQRGAFVGAALVGEGSHFKNKQGGLEIGYCVAEAHRGKGYASEIARQLVRLARDHGYFGAITATYAKDNPISGRILEKLGFERVGEKVDQSAGRAALSSYWCTELRATAPHLAAVLRPLALEDIGAIFALQHEKEGAALAGIAGEFVDENTFHKNMKSLIVGHGENPQMFAVMVGSRMAGYIGCTQGLGGKWQVSYWLAQKFWGQGVATAALRLLLEKSPQEVLEQGFYATVVEGNTASMRVLEKFGFIAFNTGEFQSAVHGHSMQQTAFRR